MVRLNAGLIRVPQHHKKLLTLIREAVRSHEDGSSATESVTKLKYKVRRYLKHQTKKLENKGWSEVRTQELFLKAANNQLNDGPNLPAFQAVEEIEARIQEIKQKLRPIKQAAAYNSYMREMISSREQWRDAFPPDKNNNVIKSLNV